jgi:hypothetical protein
MNIGGLCSLVDHRFLSFGTEEYNTIIFLDTEEDKKLRNVPLFVVCALLFFA